MISAIAIVRGSAFNGKIGAERIGLDLHLTGCILRLSAHDRQIAAAHNGIGKGLRLHRIIGKRIFRLGGELFHALFE